MTEKKRSNMKPIIIAITGPSCAGKDTLMRQIY